MRFCVAMAMAAMSASARSTVWSPRSWRDQRISNLMSGYFLAGVVPVTIEGTPEHRVVQTVLNRRKEVAEILSRRPETYLPMFMHDDGRVVIEDWTIGFMLGIGLKANAWIPLFTSVARSMLAPILSANPLGRNLLPDVSDAEIDRIKTTAHFLIADAVVALHAMCSEKHNKRRRPTKHPAGRRRH